MTAWFFIRRSQTKTRARDWIVYAVCVVSVGAVGACRRPQESDIAGQANGRSDHDDPRPSAGPRKARSRPASRSHAAARRDTSNRKAEGKAADEDTREEGGSRQAPSSSAAARPRPEAAAPTRLPVGVKDKGVFSQLDDKFSIEVPSYVSKKTTRILVNKARRVMVLYHESTPIKVYPIALGFTPKGDKKKRGDGKTPEGKYYICEMLEKNLAARYGARSLRLSFPNVADAVAGRRRGAVSAKQLAAIRAAVKAKKMPPQNTPLGSSIRIHGGGVARDWTAGCVAMRNGDVTELYGLVGLGTKVRVVASRTPGDRDNDGIPDQVDILMGAKKLVLNGASYKSGYFEMKYPMGDLPSHIGVCSDVVIRAFRNGGYDLQKLIHRDIKKHRRRYPEVYNKKSRADPSIDHRRVRNMLPYFKANYKLVDRGLTAKNRKGYLPGDIIFMDTLTRSGPDHIGIISDELAPNGYPKVINNWTVGYKTSEMNLLPSVPVTHHFRIR